jgi:hypothetical protein
VNFVADIENVLHWSFDYAPQWVELGYATQFKKMLARGLESIENIPDATLKKDVFAILPNFENSWKRDDPEETQTLRIGTLFVERNLDASKLWNYHVDHKNVTSGETLNLDFKCMDDPLRTLMSPWVIEAQNSSDGSYSSISLNGSLTAFNGLSDIQLKTKKGLSFNVGSILTDSPLICNWALLDAMRFLGENGAKGLCILDDLERLKTGCEIRPLDRWTFRQWDLTAYTVFGTGLPPSHWWLTENGDVVVVSTMLSTYILENSHGENIV